MSFSATLKRKELLPGGYVKEIYTFNGAGVTTGTITADATSNPEIVEIELFGASDDQDASVVCDTGVAPNQLKLTFSSGNTGKAFIIGRAR